MELENKPEEQKKDEYPCLTLLPKKVKIEVLTKVLEGVVNDSKNSVDARNRANGFLNKIISIDSTTELIKDEVLRNIEKLIKDKK